MKVLLSKFVEDAEQDLSSVSGSEIQLAFHKRSVFKDFSHTAFIERLRQNRITVRSVHAPAADVYHSANDEFIQMLRKIKGTYGVKVITLHPQRGDKRQAKAHYKKIEREIREMDIILAYETFEEENISKKWISQLYDMNEYFDVLAFPFLGITYDFAHSNKEKCLSEIRKYHQKIKVIHFSDAFDDMPQEVEDHHQHLPLGMGNYPVLAFLETLADIEFAGYLVLEYIEKFDNLLKADAEILRNYISGHKKPLRETLEARRKQV